MIGTVVLWFAAVFVVAALLARRPQARALQAAPVRAKARRDRGPASRRPGLD